MAYQSEPETWEDEEEGAQPPPETWEPVPDEGGAATPSAGGSPPPGWEPAGSLPTGVLGGVFKGHESTFENAAAKHNVDPDLLLGIAEFETGHGKSDMVRNRNNPGGLYDSKAGGYMSFPSLEAGIDAMASNLRRTYLDKGLTTIPDIAKEYAPVGAANDPNRTNAEWPGSVASEYTRLQKLRGSAPPEPEMVPAGWEEIQVDKNVGTLEQNVQPLAMDFLTKAQEWANKRGLEVRVTEGYRTPERQAELYAQGRTAPGPIVTNARPGQSNHQSARAFDVGIFKNGKEVDDKDLWNELGQLGKSSGLSWGGDFKSIYDPNHFELLRDQPIERPEAKPGTDFHAEEPPPGWVPAESGEATVSREEVLASEAGLTPREKLERRAQAYVESQAAKSGQVRTPTPTERGEKQIEAQKAVSEFEAAGEREAAQPLPRVTTEMATQLGLSRWIDLPSGREIRTAVPTERGVRQIKAQGAVDEFAAEGERAAEAGQPAYTDEASYAKFPEKGAPPEQLPQRPAVQIPEDIGIPGAARHNVGAARPVPPGMPESKYRSMEALATGITRVPAAAEAGLPGMVESTAAAIEAGGRYLQRKGTNPFADTPIDEVKAQIPALKKTLDAARLNTLQTQQLYGEQSDNASVSIGLESDAFTKLKWAELAAEGKKEDNILAPAGRTIEEWAAGESKDAKRQREAIEKKWAPRIVKFKETAPGQELFASIGRNLPQLATFGVGKIAAATVMWTSTFKDSQDEYTKSMQRQGKEVDSVKRDEWAAIRATSDTPFEYLENLLGAKYLKDLGLKPGDLRKVFSTVPRNMPQQSADVVGKWVTDGIKEYSKPVAGEGATSFLQSLVHDVQAEEAGVQAPTTVAQKLKTATRQGLEGALQQAIMLGVPAAAKGAASARAASIREKLEAKPPEPTFTERQAQEKATLKPGVYRNFGDIPAEPTAVEKPGVTPAAVAPTGTIPATPAAPAAEAPSLVGKTVAEGIIKRDITAGSGKEYVAKRKAEGATVEEAAAELKAENDKVNAALETALPEGSQIRDADSGDVYELEYDGMWRTVSGSERGGVKRGAAPDDVIVRVGKEALAATPAAGPTIPPIAPAKLGPTIPPAPQAAPKAGASVPTMFTKQMEADLRAKNYSSEEISKMTPAQAHEILTGAPIAPTEEEGPTPEAVAKIAEYEQVREGKPSAQGPLTSAGRALQFEDERAPAPERAAQISSLQSILATHPRSGGKPVKLIPVTRKVGGTKRQQALNRTIDGLEKALGKNIVFVRSGTEETLPFTGIVHPSHPDTIFLDAAGDRNVLALVGHEWGHTLKASNPTLHGEMVEQMKPFVKEWAKQEGKLKEEEGYPEKEVSDEVASNTIGDAFTRPDFWQKLNKKNPSLFKRVVKSVNDFFKSLVKRARGSEWGTEEFISDLEGMHRVIADAVNQAVTKGPEKGLKEAMGEGPKFAPRETKEAKPSLKAAMEGEKAEKLKEKMGGLRFAGRKEIEPRVVRSDTREKSVQGAEFLKQTTRPGHSYRGMTKAEYDNTVGKGTGVGSTGAYSFAQEGTSFGEDAKTAESYINYGRDDPRKTGKPTYLVEVSNEGLEKNRQGYFYARKPVPQSQITRVWEMRGEGDSIIAHDIATPQQPRFATRRETEPVAPREFAVRKHGFYSKLEQTVIDKIPKSASPEQVKGTIAGAGLKAEEIKWSGVNQAVDRIASENGGKVPKDKLLQYLRDDGAVRLEEVKLQDKPESLYNEPTDLTPEEYQEYLQEQQGREEHPPTRFGQYQLPGGENYREVVLAMPPQGESRTPNQIAQTKYGKDFYDLPRAQMEEIQAEIERNVRGAQPYTSSHFPDVPNYVAHARMNDRTDAEGKPGTFIEEFQSDRANQWVAARDQWVKENRGGKTFNELSKEDQEAAREYARSKVPPAPFIEQQGAWINQMFKRVLRDAVAEGKKWIGWTNGETQAERYDLSKQVDAIRLSGDFDQAIEVFVKRPGREEFEPLQTTTKDKLADVVGKDIAKKAIEEEQRLFRGLDLKVGGEDKKSTYDKTAVNEIGKYVRSWGAKVKQGEVETAKRPYELRGRRTGAEWSSAGWVETIDKAEAQLEKLRKNYPNEEWEMRKGPGTPIWKVEITPQMEKGVSEGQPLFATRKRRPHQKAAPAPERKESAAREGREPPHRPNRPTGSRVRPFWGEGVKDFLIGGGPNVEAFWQSTKEKFESMPGMEFLGQAIRKHLDRRAMYKGKYGTIADRAYRSIPMGKRKEALKGYRDYWETNQTKGRDAANAMDLSDGARKLVDTSKAIYQELGRIAEENKTKIKNPETGGYELFRAYVSDTKDYHPHRLQEKFKQAIDDPDKHPAEWDELMDMMGGMGLSQAIIDQRIQRHKDSNAINGFFGSLERRRVADLPTRAYDYSYRELTDYINSWSDRMAQIEAFGQGRGAAAGEEHKGTVWDEALRRAGNQRTRDYIKQVAGFAYGNTPDTHLGRAMMTFGNFLSGLHLGNPVSALANFISGEAMIAQNAGMIRWMKSMPGAFREIKDAKERGQITNDFMSIMHDGEIAGGIVKATSGFTKSQMQLGGFNAAETFIRGHSARAHMMMLRDAMNAYGKNPRSSKSRAYLGQFQRLGFKGTEAQDLIIEGGEGELFDRYMRAAVNKEQGGYTYADLPAFMSTPAGKVFGKYAPWGIEQLQRFQSEVMRPAVRAVTFGRLNQEKVAVVNEDGEQEMMPVPGALMPLARYLVLLPLAGAAVEELKDLFWGIPKRTAKVAQILGTFKRDQMAALNMALEKYFMYQVAAGAGGTLGNLLQSGIDVANRSRFKNPLQPPAFAVITDAANTALDIMDQGGSDESIKRSIMDLAKRQSGMYRSGMGFASKWQNAWGSNYPTLRKYAALQDANWLRSQVRRYDNEKGTGEKVRTEVRIGKGPESAFKDGFYEDILAGDTKAARTRLREYEKGKTYEQRDAIEDSLKNSIRSKQPIRSGGGGGEAARGAFLEWASRRNLPPEDIARIKRIDRTYRNAARTMFPDLFPEEMPDTKSLSDYMRKQDLAKKSQVPFFGPLQAGQHFGTIVWQK